jgi:UrcA family protein
MIAGFKGRIAVVLAGAAGSFAFLTPPAMAQQGVIYVQTAPPENLRIERVGYGDLNLATRSGEQSLQRRVDRAVERVCLYDQGRWYGLGEPDYNYCTWGAMRRARPQIIGAVYRARQLAYYRGY